MHEKPFLAATLSKTLRIAALSLILVGCGTGNVVYLYPPDSFDSPGAAPLTLVHSVLNYDESESTQSFQGYEVYYRAFDTLDAAAALLYNVNLLETNASDYSADELLSIIENSYTMKRISLDSSPGTLPLINVSDANREHTYVINLSGSEAWSLYGDETKIGTLLRNDGGTPQPSFAVKSEYDSTDIDYVDSAAGDPTTVYFVFAAVAYGVDSETFETIYSTPDSGGEVLQITPQ